MKQFIYLAAICMLALSACTGSFKKGDNGLEYKIISSRSGKTVGYGNYLQIHIKRVYAGTKDTVLMDTRDYAPRITILDSVNTPLAYFKILSQMKKGDSVIIKMLTDTAYKNPDPRNPMPDYMKKGKFLYTYIKLLNVFENKDQADSADKAEAKVAMPKIFKKQMEQVEKELDSKKAQLSADSKIIEDYLTKNNIKATKTKWGTYIAVSGEGTGAIISNTDVALVNYTGRTLDSGKVFDSNTDPKLKPGQTLEPLPVNIANLGGIILGWTDALMQLKKGSKATIYIPSTLGYGTNGNGEKIKPNENLIFDIEVVDVVNEEAYMAKMQAMQEEMMRKAQQQQSQAPGRVDSARKVK